MNRTGMGVDSAALVATLLCCLVAVVLLMGATMGLAVARRRMSIVDVAWGLGFVLVAAVSFGISATGGGADGSRWLLLVMTAAWGLRLAIHIARRNAGRPEDPRYIALMGEDSRGLAGRALRRVFVPQGVTMFVISLPIQVGVNSDATRWWLAAPGIAIWLVGLTFEGLGDAQLARFKADPAHHGQVMDRGLWRYTRHPNYFGDACVWWGLWLVAGSSWLGLATVVSPLLMTYLLAGKTGKPLTERSMAASKPGYADYVARTSSFVPLPPRRTR